MTNTVDDMRRARRRRVQAAAKNRRILLHSRGVATSLIDATPVREHLLQLRDLGWRAEALAHLNGIGTPEGIRAIMRGDRELVERKWQPVLSLPLTYAVPATVPDAAHVPARGATRRVQALLAMGWPLAALSAAADRELQHVSRGAYRSTSASDWRAVDRVWRQHAAHVGPSRLTRDRARRRGLAPPLAWDDIDDPAETPLVGRDAHPAAHDVVDEQVVERVLAGEWRLRAGRAEREEVVARWVDTGRGSLAQLERLTGWRADRYMARVDRRAVAS